MITFNWWKQGHKTVLKTVFENRIKSYMFFLLQWVCSAPSLLACFQSMVNLPGNTLICCWEALGCIQPI